MKTPLFRSYSQISLEERRKIERWRAAGLSIDIRQKNSGGIAQRFSGN